MNTGGLEFLCWNPTCFLTKSTPELLSLIVLPHTEITASSSPWENTYLLIFFCKIKLTGTHTSRFYFIVIKANAPRSSTSLYQAARRRSGQLARSLTASPRSCTGPCRGDAGSVGQRKVSYGETWASLSYFCSVGSGKKGVVGHHTPQDLFLHLHYTLHLQNTHSCSFSRYRCLDNCHKNASEKKFLFHLHNFKMTLLFPK